jgi:F-box protein, helicase, 18
MPVNDNPDPMARLAEVIARSSLSAQAAEKAVVRRYGSGTRIANPFLAARESAAANQDAVALATASAPATARAATAAPEPPTARAQPAPLAAAPSPTQSPASLGVPSRNPFSAFGKRPTAAALTPQSRATTAEAMSESQARFAASAPVPPPVSAVASSPVGGPVKKSAFAAFASSVVLPDADDQTPDEPMASAVAAAARTATTPARRTGGLERADKPERKVVNYTDEQLVIQHSDAPLIVADAFAGCGKTTAAVGYAEAKSKLGWKLLYMCLGTENAAEARKRFPPNTTCATSHAVARAAIKPEASRVENNERPWKPMMVQDLLNVSPREALLTMRVLSEFFNSSDTAISMDHVEIVNEKIDMTNSERTSAMSYAKLAWTRMQRPNDTMLIPHDAYLKMFALRAPALPYDAVIFDEAQDANPVTLQILQGQKSLKQMLCIGDRHQAIYGFRGAINAMEILGNQAERHFLTQTWRFGPKIADLANLLLGELKGEEKKILGLGKDGVWDESRVAHLTRTNAELFRLAAERMGDGVHWVGGIGKYKIEQLMDAYHLYGRERESIRNPLMKRKFQHWDEYVNYAEDASDSEAKILVKIVDDFKHDTPELVSKLKGNAVESAKDASLILTTGHRSKGMEFANVRIGDDYELLEKAEGALADNAPHDVPVQDINLLYVTLTRAMSAVQLNPEFKTWVEKIDEHRQNRVAARTRHEAAIQQMRREMSRA